LEGKLVDEEDRGKGNKRRPDAWLIYRDGID
jgi:hypothetical protein